MPVSILTHGAAGDGTTDDTAALVAALAAAGSTDYVLIPAGTYRIDGPVTLGAVTREIRGESGSILKTTDSHPGATARMFATTGDTTLTIRDLTLQGPTSSNATYNRYAISQTETGATGGTLTLTNVSILGYWCQAIGVASGSGGLNGTYTVTLSACNLKAAEQVVGFFGHDAVTKTLTASSTTFEKLDAAIANWTLYIHRHHSYTFTDCTITGSAQFNLHIFSGGSGGVHNFTRCTFGGSGGNLFGPGSTVVCTSCTFSGGVFWPAPTGTFTSCTFAAGGGTHSSTPAPITTTFTSCTFSGSAAEMDSTDSAPTWTVTSCTFTNCGITLAKGTLTATSCTFSSLASAIALYIHTGTVTASLTNCTISGAYASDRGAVRLDSGTATVTLTSCTFSLTSGTATWLPGANTVTLDRCVSSGTKGTFLASGSGGTWTIKNCLAYSKTSAAGISISGGTVAVYHCTVYGNTTGLAVSGGIVTASNNILYGNTTNLSSTGGTLTQTTNLTGTDPLFVSAGTADFRLSAGSPAIRAGTPNLGVTTDYTGTDWPVPQNPEIGAYAFVLPAGRAGNRSRPKPAPRLTRYPRRTH